MDFRTDLIEDLQEREPKILLLLCNKDSLHIKTQQSLSYKKTSSTDTLLSNLQSRLASWDFPPTNDGLPSSWLISKPEKASDAYE
jgi:hypothetical protein